MLTYTRAALSKIVTDLKRLSLIYNVASPLITIAYLIYAAVAGIGLLPVNLVLAGLTAAWLIVYLFIKDKKQRKQSKHIINRLKIATKAFSLGVAVYGIYIANEQTTVFTVVFAAINILTWVAQLAIEVLSSYAEAQLELILEGIKADFEGVKDSLAKPVRAVEGIIKKVVGSEDAATDEDKVEKPSRARRFLEKRIAKLAEQKQRRADEGKEESKTEEKKSGFRLFIGAGKGSKGSDT